MKILEVTMMSCAVHVLERLDHWWRCIACRLLFPIDKD
jgi:hypothetical protein